MRLNTIDMLVSNLIAIKGAIMLQMADFAALFTDTSRGWKRLFIRNFSSTMHKTSKIGKGRCPVFLNLSLSLLMYGFQILSAFGNH